MGPGRRVPPAGLRGDPRRRRLAALDARQLPRRRGAPRSRRSPAASCASGRRASAPRRAAESRWDPGLAARGHALLDALGFHGISQLEIKRDRRDGRDYLIEVNPRSWLWVGLATNVRGQPAPRAWRTRSGARRTCPPGHRSGVRWMLAPSTSRAAPRDPARRVDLRPFLSTLRPPVVDGVLDPRDPRPGDRACTAQRRAGVVADLRIRMEGVRPAVRAPGPLGARRPSPRRSAPRPSGPTARPTWSTRPTPGRRASGSRPTSPPRPSSRASGPSRRRPCTAAGGLTLLFPPTQPEGPIPGDLVASAFHLLARGTSCACPSGTGSAGCRWRPARSAGSRGSSLEDPAGGGLHRRPAAPGSAPAAAPLRGASP